MNFDKPLSEGISCVINTLNEEQNIENCISSVSEFADEVIVCDMYSEDRTVEIAKSMGAKIVYHEKTGFVEPARKFAISNAKYTWVLVLDADERMTETLGKKLREIESEDKASAVSFWSLFWYFGDWVRNGGFFSGNWTRFFKKNFYLDNYTEQEKYVHHNFRNLKNTKNTLKLSNNYYIKHYAYPTVEKYINKTVRKYAILESEQLAKKDDKYSNLNIILVPIKEFIIRYFLKKGFKEGLRGFILCTLYSLYKFNVYANLWYLKSRGE